MKIAAKAIGSKAFSTLSAAKAMGGNRGQDEAFKQFPLTMSPPTTGGFGGGGNYGANTGGGINKSILESAIERGQNKNKKPIDFSLDNNLFLQAFNELSGGKLSRAQNFYSSLKSFGGGTK